MLRLLQPLLPLSESCGTFVVTSVGGGTRRLYTFTRAGDLPVILHVVSTRSRQAGGRRPLIGAVVLVLCALTTVLYPLFGHQQRRWARMQAGTGSARANRRPAWAGRLVPLRAWPTPPTFTAGPTRRSMRLWLAAATRQDMPLRRGHHATEEASYGME